jgi:hypothetical protein
MDGRGQAWLKVRQHQSRPSEDHVMNFPYDSAAMKTGRCFGIFHISIATTCLFFAALTLTISTLPRTSAVTIVLASQF